MIICKHKDENYYDYYEVWLWNEKGICIASLSNLTFSTAFNLCTKVPYKEGLTPELLGFKKENGIYYHIDY